MVNSIDNQSRDLARRLGALIRAHREAAGLRLEDLAAAAGVGVRFVHDLETGKPSCQIGRALVVASSLGLNPIHLLEQSQDPAMLAAAQRHGSAGPC